MKKPHRFVSWGSPSELGTFAEEAYLDRPELRDDESVGEHDDGLLGLQPVVRLTRDPRIGPASGPA